jgi:hypothetical protein
MTSVDNSNSSTTTRMWTHSDVKARVFHCLLLPRLLGVIIPSLEVVRREIER